MPSELAAALLRVQQKLKPIKRTATGQRGRYPGLPTVHKALKPLLAEQGLVFIEKPTQLADGRFVLAYSLVHVPSGEREDGEYPMHIGPAQQQGSEVTYARRYALMAITGAVAEGEDDDGQSASEERMDRRRGPERYTGWDRPSETPVRGPRPGPEHEQLRHEPSSGSQWDGEDHWVDQPPAESGVKPGNGKRPRHNQGRLSPAQAIAVHFKRLGVTDDTERLVKTTILAGRAELLESTNDLDEAKQREIGGELAKCRDRAALDQLLDSKRAEVPS